MQSNHRKGYLRDSELLRLLSPGVAFNTEQIRFLLFRDNVERIAQRRLKVLTDKKVIKRDRISIDEPYFYYIDRKPGQVEHVLGVSWIYTWVRMTLTNMEKLHCFEREVKAYKIVRPDAFMGVKHLLTGNLSFYFMEFDMAESGNDFDKVAKYNTLYSSEGFSHAWWVPLSKRFPAVVVVTTGNKERIKERVKAENTNGLEFRIYTLNEIKEECMNGRSSSKSIRAK